MPAQSPFKRPTIKILLYTDDPYAISDGRNFLGLGSMIERLKAHAPTFADLSLKWVSRSPDPDRHAENKLDRVMADEVKQTGDPFDEIWFFGMHQENTQKFSLSVFRGGPESELTPKEVATLEKWMKVEGGGGGVLMTGDHNNPSPANWHRNGNGTGAAIIDKAKLLGLGRAIGRGVPRAGQLRKWDGPPSSQEDDCLNTLASDGFQMDRLPQKLIYELVNANGEPDPQGQPHPLFFYRSGRFIDRFPDHRHEGALIIPDRLDKNLWPVAQNGRQPKPCIVAFGTNKMSGNRIGILSAYDGDAANVGRIVADSSWHHYVNINLKGFPHPSRAGSAADKIGQFYANLAIWLAPLRKRQQMAQAMYWELAEYTLLLEQEGDPARIGEIAYSLLARSTSRCEIHELLRAFCQQQVTNNGSSPALLEDLGMTEQETLSLVLDSFRQAMIRAEQQTAPIRPVELEQIVNKGLNKAKVSRVTSAVGGRTKFSKESKRGGKSSPMTTKVENQEWTIEMKGDSEPGQPPFLATLVFSLSAQNGVVTGKVWDGVQRKFLSQVKGTHQPLEGDDHWFMALDFKWGRVNVSLSGVTVETPQTVLFTGRYRASALDATTMDGGVVPEPPPGPGDGDTGSGTGQQT